MVLNYVRKTKIKMTVTTNITETDDEQSVQFHTHTLIYINIILYFKKITVKHVCGAFEFDH